MALQLQVGQTPVVLTSPQLTSYHNPVASVEARKWFSSCPIAFVAASVISIRRNHIRRHKTERYAQTVELQQFTDLVDWLRSKGAYISPAIGLYVKESASGSGKDRGYTSTATVQAGDLLAEIPVSCCLSADLKGSPVTTSSPVTTALQRSGLIEDDALLALTLAEERQQGEGSQWWPYLRMLFCEHSFPLFFEKSDLEALDNKPLQEPLECLSSAASILASSSGSSETDLREALSLVLSRRFRSEVCNVMIPVGDLLNHSFYPSCAWEAPTPSRPDSWRLKALMDMTEGMALTFKYCEDPNHLLLYTSGFVMAENPFDRIMVRPMDLRNALTSICNTNSHEEFASWRQQTMQQEVPDPEELGTGCSMFLVGRLPGGIQWNPLWLNLVGLAVSESPNVHWSETPGAGAYFASLETASWSLFTSSFREAENMTAAKTQNQILAMELRRSYKRLLEEALSGLKQRIAP